MKIIIVSNSAAPSRNASSLQIARMCDNLEEINHRIFLILPNTGNKKNYFRYYNLKNHFRIIRLKYFKKFPLGIDYYLFGFFSMIKIVNHKPDLVITRNFFLSLLLSTVKQKHILEVHDTMEIEGRIIRFLQKSINFLNFSSLKKIISTTYTLKNFYKNFYKVDSNKIKVLHNASSIKIFKKPKFLPKKKFKIGFFGTIYSSRGLELFISLSKKDKKNDYYIFGGTKKDISKLKSQNNNKNLNLEYYLPQKKYISALKKIDICLLPYSKKITVAGDVGNISKYTSPLKIFDYMKLGKIIICSELKVLKEVLNKKNSIMIKKYHDHYKWLKEIENLKKRPFKQLELRKNAFNFSNKEDAKWRIKNILKNV